MVLLHLNYKSRFKIFEAAFLYPIQYKKCNLCFLYKIFFKVLHKNTFGISLLQKADKLYLENTNYLFAIKSAEPNIGSIRETFFLNQISESHAVTYPETGDFFIDNNYLFEVGGKSKTRKQIAGIEKAYVAAYNIEFGYDNTIPLWMFGLLY